MITEPSPHYAKTSAPRRYNSNQTKAKTRRSTKQIINEILTDNNYENVTQENAPTILKELRNIQESCNNKSNYANANAIDDACTNISNFLTVTKFSKIQTRKFEEEETKLDTARNNRQNMQSDWKRLISAAEEKRDQELNDMQQEFNNDLEEFDKLYTVEPDSRFQKFSPELLNLRYRQKALIQANNFLQAKEIKSRADELERIEREKNQSNWIDYLNKTRIDILTKQKQQIDHKLNIWNLEINKMKRNAKADINHAKQAESHFSERIERIQSISELPEMQNTITPQNPAALRRAKSQRFDRVEKFEIPLDSKLKTFRQRQIMNYIKYTKVTTPKVPKK